MKKFLLILFLTVSTILPQNITGSGTEGDPYVLYNAADVDSIRDLGVIDKFYKLGANIDMSSISPFAPIATYNGLGTADFGFDGNNKTISNLSVTTPATSTSNYAGLFGQMEGFLNFKVKDFTMDQCTIIVSGSDMYAGIFAGSSSTASGGTGYIQNVKVTNSVITVTGLSTTANVGFITGKWGGYGTITKCGTMYDSLYLSGSNNPGYYSGGITGYAEGNTTLTQCYSKYNYFYSRGTTSTRANVVGGIVGGILSVSGGSISYNYSHSNICDPGNLDGSGSTYPHAWGGIVGIFSATSGTVDDSLYENYAANNEVINYGIYESGGFAASDNHTTSITFDSSSNYCDITSFTKPDVPIGRYRDASPNTAPAAKTSATLKLLGTFYNFDFVNIWDINPALNNGYPFLQAENLADITIATPSDAGIVLETDSVYTITWAGQEIYEPYDIYLSTNAGTDWNVIDTANSNYTYDWTVPNTYSTTALIRITSDDSTVVDNSDNQFTILPHALITFLYPIEKEAPVLNVGDTAHVKFESIFTDNFLFYWSNDSTNWHFIDSITVDTTNGFVQDTSEYIWTFGADVIGPNIYGKAIAVGDTNIYSFNHDVIGYDDGSPVVGICQTDKGGTSIQKYIYYDVSCGWGSPSHVYYTRLIPDDGIGPDWYWISTSFTYPYTGADFTEPDPVNLVDGVDTTATALTSFYDDPATTLTYKQRTYFIDYADTTLRCNDNRNHIDSIFVSDIGQYWQDYIDGQVGQWSGNDLVLQLYNIQWSKLSGQDIESGINYETLNDPSFNPIIVITDPSYFNILIGVVALDTPVDLRFPSTIETLYTGAVARRFFFRGIHPKAEKR